MSADEARAAMLAAIRVIETYGRISDILHSADFLAGCEQEGAALEQLLATHESATLAELRRLTKGE